MNNFFIHLKCDIPSTIYANGEYLGVITKHNSLDLKVDTSNVYFNVFQVGKYYPYTFQLSCNSKCIDTTNSTLIVPFYNNNYDIYLSANEIKENSPSSTLIHETIGKYTVSILNGIYSSLAIYESNIIVYSENLELLNSATINIVNKNLVIKGFTLSEKYYLLILNENNEVIYNGYFDNLEENNNVLTCFTNINDMAKHGHICEIDLFNTSDIKDFYVIKDNINKCKYNELIPNAFLEAIKVKNFKLARTYLNNELNSASNSHLEAYFGNIKGIYYNCYNSSTPINYTIYNGKYEFYNFVIKDGKIIEIDKLN